MTQPEDIHQEGPACVRGSRQASRWDPPRSAHQAQPTFPEGKARVLCALCSSPPGGHSLTQPVHSVSGQSTNIDRAPPPMCCRHCSRSRHSEQARRDIDSKLTPALPATHSANTQNNHRGEGDTPSQRPVPGAARSMSPFNPPSSLLGRHGCAISQITEAQIQ